MSFFELNETSMRIADFLSSMGLEKGARVAILSSKCAEEVAVIFGVLRAGCVLVHINPAFRVEQVRHVIDECAPSALFYHHSKGTVVEQIGRDEGAPRLRICVGAPTTAAIQPPSCKFEAILENLYRAAEVRQQKALSDDDLAAIIYTSGTTATAKGILVTHKILADSTEVSARVLENSECDRLISLTPFSFDGALSQLFTATSVGGTLVLQGSPFPRDVVRTLLTERITGCHAVPSFWRMVLDRYPSFADCKFPDLRYVSLIGEPFPEVDLKRLKHILNTTDFFMMYGTTEAFRSTCLAPHDFTRKCGSVGRPLPGVTITIVDEHCNRCPPGTVGEIVHGGSFISPGYWKRSGTATFREHGVHTGDLGLLDEDGYLYFAGRKDAMIKRLGYQVYPEEIEACLAAMNAIAMAAVVCVTDADAPQLWAFVVAKDGHKVTTDAISKHCRRHLPHYMLPDKISLRSTLPLTGTYKIDKATLITEPEE